MISATEPQAVALQWRRKFPPLMVGAYREKSMAVIRLLTFPQWRPFGGNGGKGRNRMCNTQGSHHDRP